MSNERLARGRKWLMQLAGKQEKTSTFTTCYFDETQLAKALGVKPEDWQTLLDLASLMPSNLEMGNVMVPILHVFLGIVNDIWGFLVSFVELKIETFHRQRSLFRRG